MISGYKEALVEVHKDHSCNVTTSVVGPLSSSPRIPVLHQSNCILSIDTLSIKSGQCSVVIDTILVGFIGGLNCEVCISIGPIGDLNCKHLG